MIGSRKMHSITELIGMKASESSKKYYSLLSAEAGDGRRLMHQRTCHTGANTLKRMIRLKAANDLNEVG